jgi:hypothetical protein
VVKRKTRRHKRETNIRTEEIGHTQTKTKKKERKKYCCKRIMLFFIYFSVVAKSGKE